MGPDPSLASGRSLKLVSGPAGQGKTRLGMEFMRQCHEAGWVVVSATELDRARSAYPDGDPSAVPRRIEVDAPVLVVADYADRWLFDTLISLVRDLEYSLARRRPRILLLARPPQTLWVSISAELDRGPQMADPLMLSLLDELDARAAAFRSAVAAFRAALAAPDGTVEPPDDLTHPEYGNPLTLHMAALVRLYAAMEHTTVPARDALSLYLLRHERRYWERMCRSYAKDGRARSGTGRHRGPRRAAGHPVRAAAGGARPHRSGVDRTRWRPRAPGRFWYCTPTCTAPSPPARCSTAAAGPTR